MTKTLTLTDFLLDRIETREVVVQRVLERAGFAKFDGEYVDPHARSLLAECEAMRRIVEQARDYSPELEHGDNGEWALDLTLRALAAVYADHPDYRDEWRP